MEKSENIFEWNYRKWSEHFFPDYTLNFCLFLELMSLKKEISESQWEKKKNELKDK